VRLIEKVLSDSYADLRIGAHGQGGGLHRTRSGLGPSVQLDRHRWTLAFEATGAPLGVLAVASLRAGQVTFRSAGSERRYGPGDVFVAVQPGDHYTATGGNRDTEVAVFDPAYLSQVAGTAPGRAPQPVRLTGYEPVSAQAAQSWKAISAYVRGAVPGRPGTATGPLVTAGLARLLAAAALATFPSNALADPTAMDRRDAHPETLRRARAFIEENSRQDISIAGIAAAAGVTIRTVQLAFRRHLGVTPVEYLRQVRLQSAHRDLLAADPAATTVTTVAYRWGFASSSRFAAYYRQAYGRSPSRTLRHG
jgi:AraC-like DNA-binding protein